MMDRLGDEATTAEIVDTLNRLVDRYNNDIKSSAVTVLVGMVRETGGRVPLSLLHTALDGEEVIGFLVDQGMAAIVDGRDLEATELGREQVALLTGLVAEQVEGK
jgi:hypothetical protein